MIEEGAADPASSACSPDHFYAGLPLSSAREFPRLRACYPSSSSYNESVVTLRGYKEADFSRLMEIDKACFVEGIAYPEDEMRYFLDRRSAVTLVAEDSGRIQGFVIADRFRSRRVSHSMGRIITIDVAPEVQERGFGSLLLTSVEQELKRLQCDYVSLEVAVDNNKAMRFYKKHGYSVLKVLPRYYLDSIDGLLMGKKL